MSELIEALEELNEVLKKRNVVRKRLLDKLKITVSSLEEYIKTHE